LTPSDSAQFFAENGLSPASGAVVRSKAPLRISFCGGGTDVPPYPETHGGCVLSCTIDKFAYVSIRARTDERIRVTSLDQKLDLEYHRSEAAVGDGKLDIAHSIFRRFGSLSLDCFMQSNAPPGSGLGSSSTMIVALIAALAKYRGLDFTRYEMAELAYKVEREDLRIVGGMQDQYAAAFGGFNFIEFTKDGVIVNPLRISDDAANELHYHLLLCYTGVTRLSSNILKEQTNNVTTGVSSVLDSLSKMKTLTIDLKKALLRGRLAEFGDLLDQAWWLKKKLASAISNTHIDELYDVAKSNGAIGGKLLGAGGGGYLLLFVPFTRRERVARAMEVAGGRIVDFQFDGAGVRSWSATDTTWTDHGIEIATS
jgi:D-glycero-alpha-D-manno-heptose-7-phosphate kinase